ncbi:MAG: hypothetical protein KL863_22615 [Rhizobium sp.]|nr:hypothetical protein [Rhizobium sp.]
MLLRASEALMKYPPHRSTIQVIVHERLPVAQMAQLSISDEIPRHMSPFLVVFDDWRGREHSARHDQINAQAAQAEHHREQLQSFIKSEGLSGSVLSVAPATTLGMIGIVATREAVERLSSMNGVVRIIPSM